MTEYLTKQGYTVHPTACGVLLTRKDQPDLTWSYNSLRSAYDAQGGPQTHIQHTGGKAKPKWVADREERQRKRAYIRSKGLLMYCGFKGVHVWDAKDPSLEWEYPTLDVAYTDIQRLFEKETHAQG